MSGKEFNKKYKEVYCATYHVAYVDIPKNVKQVGFKQIIQRATLNRFI